MPRPPLLAVLLLLFPSPAHAATWQWPVQGEVITPYRNGADPYAAGQHRGIDIAAGVGTPVVAATAGTVRFAGVAGSSGITVSLRTADGLFDTSYLHLSSVQVDKGEQVGEGDRLGAVGTSGRRSAEAPHLHFGVREAGSRSAYRDPLDFLPPLVPPPEPEVPPAAPAPAPAPARPAPAPRRVPVGRRVPLGRRIPAGERVPLGHRVPARHPLRRPGSSPSPSPAPVPLSVPETVPRGRFAPAPRAHGAPGPAPAPLPLERADGGTAARDRPDPIAAQPPATRPVPRGPDLGWALACLGLLLAAACIGLTGDQRRRTSDRGRAAIAALLRPLGR